jgi:hypothetical protein
MIIFWILSLNCGVESIIFLHSGYAQIFPKLNSATLFAFYNFLALPKLPMSYHYRLLAAAGVWHQCGPSHQSDSSNFVHNFPARPRHWL